jgi:hypothetical protein
VNVPRTGAVFNQICADLRWERWRPAGVLRWSSCFSGLDDKLKLELQLAAGTAMLQELQDIISVREASTLLLAVEFL